MSSTPEYGRPPRAGHVLAGVLAGSLIVAGITLGSAADASAATTAMNARSVGNFFDATVGNKPADQVVKVQYAAATSPGTTSQQNPLHATVLNTVDAPLTGTVQEPETDGIKVGAANQVAVAKPDGYAYGAAGAVSNSGGAAVGGDDTAFPADTSFDVDPSQTTGATPVPIPGAPSASALGTIHMQIGAVAARAMTTGGTRSVTSTAYEIDGLDMIMNSPALAQLFSQFSSSLNPSSLETTLTGLLGGVLPSGCNLSGAALPKTLSLEGGSVTIDTSTGTLTFDLGAFLKQLGLNLNALPANTDLATYVANYFTSVSGLTAGLQGLLDGLAHDLQTQFGACASAIPGGSDATSALTNGQTQLQDAANSLFGRLSGFGGSGVPLSSLGASFKKLIDIGANVQPNGAKGTFTSALAATPKQGTAVVAGQTVVRAVEVDLAGDPATAFGLANAAAGPSSDNGAPPSNPTNRGGGATPDSNPGVGQAVPTGVPAGDGVAGGSPTLPLVLLASGLAMAGVGALSWRLRGRFTR